MIASVYWNEMMCKVLDHTNYACLKGSQRWKQHRERGHNHYFGFCFMVTGIVLRSELALVNRHVGRVWEWFSYQARVHWQWIPWDHFLVDPSPPLGPQVFSYNSVRRPGMCDGASDRGLCLRPPLSGWLNQSTSQLKLVISVSRWHFPVSGHRYK